MIKRILNSNWILFSKIDVISCEPWCRYRSMLSNAMATVDAFVMEQSQLAPSAKVQGIASVVAGQEIARIAEESNK